jgi:hypothetical protein
MTAYIVYLATSASTSVEVEADSPEEAEDKAYQAKLPTLCAQCSGWNNPPGVELNDTWEISETIKKESQ